VELLAGLFAAAALVALLVAVSRRWGGPRLYVARVSALWIVAAILALIAVWLALD